MSDDDKISISDLTSTKENDASDAELIIGEMDGSPIKLIYTLARHGIFNFFSLRDRQEFSRIANEGEINQGYNSFILKNIINRLTVNNKNGKIIFIGSVAYREKDSALSSELNLSILNKLNSAGYEYSIPLSKGDAKYIRSSVIDHESSIMTQAYLSHLKLIEYSRHPVTGKLSIFTHGPIDWKQIYELSKKLEINNESASKLIDGINSGFLNGDDEISKVFFSDPYWKAFSQHVKRPVQVTSEPFTDYQFQISRPNGEVVFEKVSFRRFDDRPVPPPPLPRDTKAVPPPPLSRDTKPAPPPPLPRDKPVPLPRDTHLREGVHSKHSNENTPLKKVDRPNTLRSYGARAPSSTQENRTEEKKFSSNTHNPLLNELKGKLQKPKK